MAVISCRSTSITGATDDTSLEEALCLLDAMCNDTDLHPLTDLYFFVKQYILNKGNRTMFLKARSNKHHYGQLRYNYDAYMAMRVSGGM